MKRGWRGKEYGRKETGQQLNKSILLNRRNWRIKRTENIPERKANFFFRIGSITVASILPSVTFQSSETQLSSIRNQLLCSTKNAKEFNCDNCIYAWFFSSWQELRICNNKGVTMITFVVHLLKPLTNPNNISKYYFLPNIFPSIFSSSKYFLKQFNHCHFFNKIRCMFIISAFP